MKNKNKNSNLVILQLIQAQRNIKFLKIQTFCVSVSNKRTDGTAREAASTCLIFPKQVNTTDSITGSHHILTLLNASYSCGIKFSNKTLVDLREYSVF